MSSRRCLLNRNPVTRRVFILMAVLAVGVAASADEVRVGRLPYSGVRVTGFTAGQISFRTAGGEVSRPLSAISLIQLDGQSDFNEAEELLSDGSYGEAVDAYRRAVQATDTHWTRRLINCRLIQALDGAGRFAEAVEQWMSAVSANEYSEAVLDLRPVNLPGRGDEANDQVIRLLEDSLTNVDDENYADWIRGLLADLYRLEGRDDDAEQLAAQGVREPSQQQRQDRQIRPRRTTQTSGGGGGGRGRLDDIRELVDEGDAERALGFVEARMQALDSEHMPEALVLSGRARMQLYEAEGDKDQLLGAGLDFMRVVAVYGGADATAEAMYRAGVVNKRLGNASAARRVWQTLIGRYGDSEFASHAAEGIEELSREDVEDVPPEPAVDPTGAGAGP